MKNLNLQPLKVIIITTLMLSLAACNSGGSATTEQTSSNKQVTQHQSNFTAYPDSFNYCVVGAGPAADIFIRLALEEGNNKILQLKYQYLQPRDKQYFTFDLDLLASKFNVSDEITDNVYLENIAQIRSGGSLSFISLYPGAFSTTSIHSFELGIEKLFENDSHLKVERLENKINKVQIDDLIDSPNCQSIVIATGANEDLAKSMNLSYIDSSSDYTIPLQPQELYGVEHYNISINYNLRDDEVLPLDLFLSNYNDKLNRECDVYHENISESQNACIYNNNNNKLSYASIIKSTDDKRQLIIQTVIDISKDKNKPTELEVKRLVEEILRGYNIEYNPEQLVPGSNLFTVNPRKLNLPDNKNYIIAKNKKVYFIGDVYKHPIYYRGEGIEFALNDSLEILGYE